MGLLVEWNKCLKKNIINMEGESVMKIRTDFVTNSSSSSFCVEVEFKSKNGETARLGLEVSPETCFSADGEMTGENISLESDWSESIDSITDIDELCELLCSSAVIEGWRWPTDAGCDKNFVVTGKMKYYSNREEFMEIMEEYVNFSKSISKKTDFLINNDINSTSSKNRKAKELGIPIITEEEFLKRFAPDEYEDLVGEDMEWEDVSITEVAPKTIWGFKQQYKTKNITLENLASITVRNTEEGNGDSAKWVEADNEVFSEYREKYKNATEEEKEKILNELFTYIKDEKGMELPVEDNCYELDDVEPCIWNGSDTELREKLKECMEGKLSGYWMAKVLDEYTIHFNEEGREFSSRKGLLFGHYYHK